MLAAQLLCAAACWAGPRALLLGRQPIAGPLALLLALLLWLLVLGRLVCCLPSPDLLRLLFLPLL